MADQASDKSPEATIDAAPGGRAGWTAVTVFLILYAVAYLDRQVITLLVDPIRADLGISDFQISILQGSAFVLFFTIFGLPIGWAVDRVKHRRRIVFIGIVIWSLAAAAGGLARTYWQLMLSRFGVGAGEASLAPTAYSMLSDLFPKDRLAGAMAVYSTGAIVGGAISLMLGGLVVALASASSSYSLPVIGELSPWQLVFIITGLPGLGLAFLVFLIAEPRRRGRIKDAEAAGASMPSLLPYLKSRAGFYAAHMFGFSFLGLMAAGYANWVPTFLMRKFEMPVANVGFTLGGLNLVGGVGGMLGGAYFVDYLFRRGMHDAHLRFYMWLALACCGFGLGAMLSPSLEVALACMFGVKAVTPFIAVAAAALQITTPNEYRGRVSALFLFIYNIIAYGAGPSIMAGISDFAIGGDGDLGLAIAITFGIFGPLAALTLGFGMKPMRRAVRLSEAWSGK